MATTPPKADRDAPDELTGLGGLVLLRETVAGWRKDWQAAAHPCPINAMLVSLGRIDTVNVAFGETAGDLALVEVARRIRHFAGDELESDTWLAARLVGGNFLLVARAEMSADRWQWLAEALADALAAPIANPSGESSLRLWPRIALMKWGESDDVDIMLDRLSEVSARLRMSSGRRIAYSDEAMDSMARTHIELESDLLAAIDRDEIEILFQPQYSLADDRIVGAEALARWHHSIVGEIGADMLFQIAERVDHVAQLSRHIAERALEKAKNWPDHLHLSINITPSDLAADNFASDFTRMAERSGFPLSRITLEITEHVLLADTERVERVLQKLKELGVSIALDDFGAGFCNFHYLKVLPIDFLKLDRSMLAGVIEKDRDRAVFRAIMGMAKALGLKVLVEGVETEQQRAFIAAEDCGYYQGFLRSEALPDLQFEKLVTQQ